METGFKRVTDSGVMAVERLLLQWHEDYYTSDKDEIRLEKW
jgi:hypothetical protein